MTDETIKLPGSSFDEIGKIVQAYSQVNKPMSLADVSKRTGIHTTIVSKNNGFLLSVGIIEGGKSKAVTALGRRLGHALGHNLESEIASSLHEVVEESEFLRNIIGAIRIRKGMDEGALKAHIAYSAGQPKSQGVMTGTGAVVELLRRARLVEEREGKLVAATLQEQALPVPLSTAESLAGNTKTSSVALSIPNIATGTQRVTAKAPEGMSVNIDVKIQVTCEAAELEYVGTQLRQMLSELYKSDEPELG